MYINLVPTLQKTYYTSITKLNSANEAVKSIAVDSKNRLKHSGEMSSTLNWVAYTNTRAHYRIQEQ